MDDHFEDKELSRKAKLQEAAVWIKSIGGKEDVMIANVDINSKCKGTALAAQVKQLDENANTAKEGGGFKSRILGGKIADKGEYPYLVTLSYEGEIKCGGTIQDEDTILTAAYCVSDDPFQSNGKFIVKAGDYLRNVKDPEEQKSLVTSITLHPNFDTFYKDENDIALLKLKTPLRFNKYVKKIQAANKSLEKKLLAKRKCFIAGFGYGLKGGRYHIPKKMLETDVTVKDRSECLELATAYQERFSKYKICTFDVNKRPCSGDYGGPLVCFDKKTAYQVGVQSPSYYFGCWRSFISYTRVSMFKKWIKKNL